jgi:hypothetical protein
MIAEAFHSSPFPGGFPYDDWTHVGSRAAAEDRIRTVTAADYGLPANTLATMYTVRVTGRLYPRTLTDEQASELWGAGHPGVLSEWDLPDGHGYTVFPYTNEAEDPGSISYLAHRSALRTMQAEIVSSPRLGERR